MIKLKKILRKADAIPPIPGVVGQVLEITSDPEFSMDRLVKVITVDPGITAKVLNMANSSFFGLRHKATSLSQAIPHIGSENLIEIALGSGLAPHLAGSQPGYHLAHGELWRHCIATALIATKLAKKLGLQEHATIYTAALLHDMGKLVLSSFVGEAIDQIQALVIDEGWALQEAERQVLGVDHAVIGGYVAKKWRLGDPTIKAVFHHHSPEKDKPPRTVTNVVAMANYLAKSCGAGCGFCDTSSGPPTTAMLELEIYPEQRQQLIEEMTALIHKAQPLFNIV